MKSIFYKILLFFAAMAVSWLLLSFYFFPIKAGVDTMGAEAFFWAAVTHMAAIKLIISLIFSVFALFVSELRAEKKRKQMQEKTVAEEDLLN